MRLLAQGAVQQTIVVKAEGFRVLIVTHQVAMFKGRLRKLGDLM